MSDQIPQSTETAHDRCRCGVYRYAHYEGRGCGHYRKGSRLRLWYIDHSIWRHVAAPIWLRVSEKHRWTVVHWLNKSRRRCWSDLVSDALTNREADPCDTRVPNLRADRAPRCASTCDWMHPDHAGEHDCSCYCGKFQFLANDGANERRMSTPTAKGAGDE